MDLGAMVGPFFVVYLLGGHWGDTQQPLYSVKEYLPVLYIVVPVWAFLLQYNRAHRTIRTKLIRETLYPIFKTIFTGGAVLMILIFIFKLDFISRTLILMFLCSSFIVLMFLRVVIHVFTHYIRKKGLSFRTYLITGVDGKARALADTLSSHKECGVKTLGFVVCNDDGP